MVTRRIYWALIILAIVIGIYFYGIAPDRFDPDFLLFFALLPFLLFAGGVHGLIAHTLSPSIKGMGGSFFYPLIMGLVFALLFFLHIFVVIPLVCPEFLKGF